MFVITSTPAVVQTVMPAKVTIETDVATARLIRRALKEAKEVWDNGDGTTPGDESAKSAQAIVLINAIWPIVK